MFLVLRHGAAAYGAFLGAMRAGLIPAFLPPPSPKQEPEAFWAAQKALFARTRPAAAVVGEADAAVLLQAAEPVGCPLLIAEGLPRGADVTASVDPDPATPALLQHSSGTTGLKKAVRFSFAQVDRHAGMLAASVGFGSQDVVASWLPLYHDMGLMAAFLAPLTLGASVIALDPLAWAADPASILRAITRHRATLCWMPNFALAHLVRTHDAAARHDLSSLRALINCSEPCRPQTVDAFCSTFAPFGFTADRMACSYGMAETVFACTQTALGSAPRRLTVDADRLERTGEVVATTEGRTQTIVSCGAPIPGVDLRIAGPAPTTEAALTAGEIEVASAVMFDGYHHGESQPVDPPVNGWRASGDIGFIHKGELFVCGRTMERLVVHGRNIFAGDVEALVSTVPGVKPGRAVALAVADTVSGADGAWVMLEAKTPLPDPADREALKRAVLRAVEGALDLTLQGVEIGPPGWLAKSTSGKMGRSQNLEKLRRLIAQAPPPPRQPVPSRRTRAPAAKPGTTGVDAETSLIRGAVIQALAECFGPAAVGVSDEAGFGEVPGWDSLGHTVVILRIEALTGLQLGESAAATARTVGRLVSALQVAAAAEPLRRVA